MFILGILSRLEDLMVPCLFRMLFHLECPGCGFQRSLVALLRGRWQESLQLYWATGPILAMLFVLGLHLKFDFRSGSRLLLFLYCFNTALIICQYLLKLTYRF